VHSSRDVLKFRPLAEAARTVRPGGPIRVISEEYWPLPWYLRGMADVGYWTEAPADCSGALVIASVAQADTVRARLGRPARETFVGLRPGFLCVVFHPEP
jgi:predicted membrane-bound mannosyltransferase